jgi:hypothetical protein
MNIYQDDGSNNLVIGRDIVVFLSFLEISQIDGEICFLKNNKIQTFHRFRVKIWVCRRSGGTSTDSNDN